ncbi:MAG: LarC family nickel insertion protein [Elusimicrobia bacterium]|nr:LarC family nickel insertion protein [Elusimicrobiota bacterium]
MIYLDCYQGVSGDMLVGGLLDVCGNTDFLRRELKKSNVGGVSMKAQKTIFRNIHGTRIRFSSKEEHPRRNLKEIKKLIGDSRFSAGIKKNMLKTYGLIYAAESAVHGVPAGKIHLHELSSLETFCEIASYFILKRDEDVYAGTLVLGEGQVKAHHGFIPVPSPVTAEILKGVKIRMTASGYELVTPTAAALLKISCRFEKPQMIIDKTGYGFGSRSILRVHSARLTSEGRGEIFKAEVSVDDMTPEDIAVFAEELRKVSNEVYTVPVIMKKGRPGYVITAVAAGRRLDELKRLVFGRSSTLGLRYWEIDREVLSRRIVKFRSSYGICRIKEAKLPDGRMGYKPESDDIRGISKKTGLDTMTLRRNIIKEYEDK